MIGPASGGTCAAECVAASVFNAPAHPKREPGLGPAAQMLLSYRRRRKFNGIT